MENNNQTSKMKTWEWVVWLVLSIIVDVVQIILNVVFGSGVLINRLITLAFGSAMGGYLYFRGVSLVNPRVLLRYGGTFVAEFIPLMDFLPVWAIGTTLTWMTTKSAIVSKATGAATKASNLAGKGRNALNNGGVRSPNNGGGVSTSIKPLVVDGVRSPMK